MAHIAGDKSNAQYPRHFSNAAATTASFSIGDMLQVEYSSRPEGFKMVRPRFKIALCTSKQTKSQPSWLSHTQPILRTFALSVLSQDA